MADINVIVLPDGTEYPVSDYYLPVNISNPTDGQVLKYDATNDVWYNGDDAEGSSVFYGTSAPTSQLGVNGNLYVKYTEGTGGASDTVDDLYVKLDGSWCQISTGGGGTSDYNDLTNKPQINSVELSGNKSLDDLGIQSSEISKTATGSIVTFSDGGDNIPVESFECEIVAQQEAGTPTPDNQLLITGFDSADIPVSGVNIWQYGDLSVTTNQSLDVDIPVGTYNLSGEWVTNSGYNCLVIFYDENNTEIVRSTFTPDIRDNKSYQFNTPCKRIVFYSGDNYLHSNGKTATISNIMLKPGSGVADYEPYTGTLYSIDFGQTIYGGRLIYSDGQWAIEATHVDITDLGALSWTKGSKSFYADITGAKIYAQSVIPNMLCEVYKPVSYDDLVSEQYNEVCSIDRNLSIILIRDTNYATASDFATAVTGKKAIYELATPVIIPLTSLAKIKTLSGVNNIFSNTGDSTLKYFTNNADKIAELVKAEIASTNIDYHKYSTEEKIVGEWIDGKTLYEKTIPFTTPNSNAYTSVPTGVTNADKAWIDTATTFVMSTYVQIAMIGSYVSNPSGDQFGGLVTNISGTLTFDYRVGSNFQGGKQGYATIRYTKSS